MHKNFQEIRKFCNKRFQVASNQIKRLDEAILSWLTNFSLVTHPKKVMVAKDYGENCTKLDRFWPAIFCVIAYRLLKILQATKIG